MKLKKKKDFGVMTLPEKAPRKLSLKQQRFIQYYQGNATQAALKAGYSPKTAFASGAENLTKPKIVAAIKERETKRTKSKIASREERQEFWSKMMKKAKKDTDRLKASELLGRSEADFIDTHNVNAKGELTITLINSFKADS